jgi:hypothetical protein
MKMSKYEPTRYDTKLEELITKVGESIQFQFESGEDPRVWVERQKLLHFARSPEYVKYLEEQRGIA